MSLSVRHRHDLSEQMNDGAAILSADGDVL
jgi:hypothetical protein